MPAIKVDVQLTGQFVKLPVSGQKGKWNWFLPYVVDDPNNNKPTYAQMDVQEDLGDKKYEKPPYNFIEGFLQLMGSLEQKQSEDTNGG